MPYRKDKVSDVMAVLIVIKEEFARRTKFCSSASLRKEAIEELAETELRTGRYRNEHSAVETLRDACTRRLKPDSRAYEISIDTLTSGYAKNQTH